MKTILILFAFIVSTQALPVPKIPIKGTVPNLPNPVTIPPLNGAAKGISSLASTPAFKGTVAVPKPTLPAKTQADIKRVFGPKKVPPLAKQNVLDLPLGHPAGEGGNSAAYLLPKGEVAIILKEDTLKFYPRERQYLEETVEYMRSITTKVNGVPVAPEVLRYITDSNGRIIGYVTKNYGKSLATILDELPVGTTLPREEIEKMMKDLRTQMAALHKDGKTHRDLHPGNIMPYSDLDGTVKIKLIDFDPSLDTNLVTRIRDDERFMARLEELLYKPRAEDVPIQISPTKKLDPNAELPKPIDPSIVPPPDLLKQLLGGM